MWWNTTSQMRWFCDFRQTRGPLSRVGVRHASIDVPSKAGQGPSCGGTPRDPLVCASAAGQAECSTCKFVLMPLENGAGPPAPQWWRNTTFKNRSFVCLCAPLCRLVSLRAWTSRMQPMGAAATGCRLCNKPERRLVSLRAQSLCGVPTVQYLCPVVGMWCSGCIPRTIRACAVAAS